MLFSRVTGTRGLMNYESRQRCHPCSLLQGEAISTPRAPPLSTPLVIFTGEGSAVNSVMGWVGREWFNGTDLPDELPEAVMNGSADGLMTDKGKKIQTTKQNTSAGNSWKTTHCRDNYKCRVTAVKVNGVWRSFSLKGSSIHTCYFEGGQEFSMQIFRSIFSLGT